MASLANTAFLNRLKTIYPHAASAGSKGMQVVSNPWYILTTVGFSGSNRPESVPAVFRHVLDDLAGVHKKENVTHAQAHNEKLLLARKFRDSLFKSGLTTGYPRAINSMVSLHEAMPEELRDTRPLRNLQTPIEEYMRRGENLFRSMYGETADPVQKLLDSILPDMGWFSNTIGYGATYGFTEVTTPLETSFILVAALISVDTPRQINWHLGNARRTGATLEQVKAARQIVMEVAETSGVRWKDGVPEIKE